MELVHDLPGVGENLQDHMIVYETYETHEPVAHTIEEMKVSIL